MKIIYCFLIFIPALAFAKGPLTLKNEKKECFDPRVAFFQCAEGETFDGWVVGECKDGLVESGKCKDECFDPTVISFKCNDGLEFKGWEQGNCKDGMVSGGICE